MKRQQLFTSQYGVTSWKTSSQKYAQYDRPPLYVQKGVKSFVNRHFLRDCSAFEALSRSERPRLSFMIFVKGKVYFPPVPTTLNNLKEKLYTVTGNAEQP